MFGQYDNICIKGVAAVAPEDIIENMEFAEQIGNRRAKKQVKLTGISKRHVVVEGQSASDMCCQAAEKLFTKLDWERDSIRVLVFVTQSEDVKTPSTAMIIQKRLGIGQDCLAFDVNLGCSGYVSGLQIVAALLNNTGGRALLLCGDGKYYNVRKNTSTDAMLFGDAGTATAIELEPGYPLLYSQKTDGTRHKMLTMSLDGQMTMDGNGVLLFSLNEVVDSIKEMKAHFKIDEEQIDYYVFHQAQKLVIDSMAAECEIPNEKVLISYEEFANTSTATLPLTICHNAGLMTKKKKVRVYLCGFGVGLTWSSVVLDLDTDAIMPVELSSYCYNDLALDE